MHYFFCLVSLGIHFVLAILAIVYPCITDAEFIINKKNIVTLCSDVVHIIISFTE